LAPRKVLARGLGRTLGANLAAPERWLGSARGWANELVTAERWGVVWIFVLVALALAARRRNAWSPPGVRLLSLALGLTALSWYLVYVLTPRDQSWHITFSLERLLLQLFPTALVWLACVVSEHTRGRWLSVDARGAGSRCAAQGRTTKPCTRSYCRPDPVAPPP
jgi:hypothetical protein